MNITQDVVAFVEDLMWQGLDTTEITKRVSGNYRIEMVEAVQIVNQIVFNEEVA